MSRAGRARRGRRERTRGGRREVPSRAQSAGAHDFGAGHHVHVDWLVADSVRRDLPRVICVGAAGAEHHTCDSPRPLIWRASQKRLSSRISGRPEVQRKMIGPTHDNELVTCRRRRRRAHHSQRNRCQSTHSCIPSAPAPKAPGTTGHNHSSDRPARPSPRSTHRACRRRRRRAQPVRRQVRTRDRNTEQERERQSRSKRARRRRRRRARTTRERRDRARVAVT